MSAEAPNIISVDNDVIRVGMPVLEGGNKTFLTAQVAATGTTLTVLDNTGLDNNDYLGLGNPGDEQAEIVKIGASVTRGTSITVGATVFPHPKGTPVYLLRYNQVAVYGSNTAGDTSPTIIGSAENLDISAGFNEIVASTTYDYYFARFYNVQTTTYSAYATNVASAGLTRTSAGRIIDYALKHTNTKLETFEGLTRDTLLEYLNDWQDEVVLQKRKWSWLRTNNDTSPISLIQTQQEYTLPTDLQNTDSNESILSVKMGGQTNALKYLTPAEMGERQGNAVKSYLSSAITSTSDATVDVDSDNDFTASGEFTIQGDAITYTSKSSNTFSGVGDISSTHSVDDEVWQNFNSGIPEYYSIRADKLHIWPLPDSDSDEYNLYIDYYKSITDLTEDASTTVIPFYNSAHYYLMWQIEIFKGDPSQRADSYEARFRQILNEGLNKETVGHKVAFRPPDSNTNISKYYDA